MLSSSLRNHARRMLSHGGFPSRLETTLNHHHHRISANVPPLNIFNPLRFSTTSRTSISSAYTRALLNHQQKPESPPLKSEKIPENIPKISILPSLSCINQPMKETLVSTNLDSKENSESSDLEDETSSKRGWLLVKNVLKKINWKRVCIIIGVLSVLGLLGYIATRIIMFWLLMYLLVVLFVAMLQGFFLALSPRKEKENDDTV